MDKITKAIDSLIERTVGKNGCVTAVEAGEELDKLGLLKDSKTRKGQPLRKILRAGKLPQAKQDDGKHWYIYHSSSCPKYSCANANKPKVDVNKNQSSKIHHIKGLDPVFDENSQILILGTMPGKDSLEKQEYYASTNNCFWYIMAELFNERKNFLNYDEKISCLKKNKIALWDIYHSCDRESSKDKDIRNEVYNDINKFIKENPSIKHVVFNGKKASIIQINVDSEIAPSTSNLNTRMSNDNKKKVWKKILNNMQ